MKNVLLKWYATRRTCLSLLPVCLVCTIRLEGPNVQRVISGNGKANTRQINSIPFLTPGLVLDCNFGGLRKSVRDRSYGKLEKLVEPEDRSAAGKAVSVM